MVESTTDKLNDTIEELHWWRGYALRLERGIKDVQEIANNSEGVVGYHLNGDIAAWDELLSDSVFDLTVDDIKNRENGHVATELRKTIYLKAYDGLPCTVQYTPVYGGIKYTRD